MLFGWLMNGLFDSLDFFWLLLIGFYAVMALLLFLNWFRNKDKYLIRIKYPTEQKRLMHPEGDEIILEKGKGKRPSWRVKFDMACLYFSKTNFGLSKRLTMDVMPDASHAIPYYEKLKADEIPKWNRKEHEEYANLSVLKALQRLGQQKTDPLLWIIIILLIVNIILPFIINRGFMF